MKIEGKEHYVVAYAVLIKGEDYTEEELAEDMFQRGGPKMLEGTTLHKIARENGYDFCDWSSNEINGEIKATFRKRKECKCNDAVGKSCDCGSKS